MTPKDREETIQYWMGSVDATLKNIQDAIEKNIAWQNGINARLDNGSKKFSNITGRLITIETSQKSLPNPNPFDPEKVVQWSWIRKEMIFPVFRYGVTLVVAYIFGKVTGVIP